MHTTLETSRLDLHRFEDSANRINDIDIDIEGETAIRSLSEYGEISTDDDDYSAAVVLHRNDDGSWTEQQRLLEVPRPRGYSVSTEEDKIVVLDENLEVRLYEPDNNGNPSCIASNRIEQLFPSAVNVHSTTSNASPLPRLLIEHTIISFI